MSAAQPPVEIMVWARLIGAVVLLCALPALAWAWQEWAERAAAARERQRRRYQESRRPLRSWAEANWHYDARALPGGEREPEEAMP